MKPIHLEIIELDTPGGKLHPVLLWDKENVILIDTGLPECRTQLIERITALGFSPESITKVILTHQDMDHIGNAHYFASLNAKIYAPRRDTPYITGSKELIKYTILKEKPQRDNMEEAIYQVIKKNLPEVSLDVDVELSDTCDEILLNGIQIINTSGHTPGHVSIYLPSEKILIAGDAVDVANGNIVPPNQSFCSNYSDAVESYEKIKKIDSNKLISYHFGSIDS